MMKSRYGRIASLLVCSGVLLAGCAADDSSEAVVAETPQDAVPDAVEQSTKDHFKLDKSPARLLLKQADSLELSAPQREALSALRSELDRAKQTSGKRAAKRAFQQTLADGVRAGTLDRRGLEQHVDGMRQAMAHKHRSMVTALASLHDMLTPEQRTQLVAATRAGIAEKMANGRGSCGHDKSFAKGDHGHAGKLLRHVELSDDQQKRFEAATDELRAEKPSHDAMKQRFAEKRAKVDAMFEAFQSATFDAASLVPDMATDRLVAKVEHQIEAVAALMPILTDAQRVQLADGLTRKDDKDNKDEHDRSLPAL